MQRLSETTMRGEMGLGRDARVSALERAVKLLVIGWACAAVAAIVFFIRPGWHALPMLAAAAFVVLCAASAVDRRAVGVVLALIYLFPIAVRKATGINYPPNYVVWTAGLLGAMVPDAIHSGWRVVGRWRPALVCWALVVAAGGTIVTLREFDFTSALIYTTRVPNSSVGGWPAMQAAWVLNVSVVLVVGMLWFDWLHGLGRREFERYVALPMAASVIVSAMIALYQLFVDVTALNPTVYGAMGRASGAMMDANVLGTIAGMWVGGWLLLGASERRPPVWAFACAAICWLAVWATGSRTGLATALTVTLFGCWAFLPRVRRGLARLPVAAAVAAVAVAIAALVALAATGGATGPLSRFRGMIPTFTGQSVAAMFSELWNRNGYGPIATAMFRFAPAFGVGVGSYQIMQTDFSRLYGLALLPPDNAQNWFRHQLAEFGLIGCLAWIVWVGTFGWFVLRPRSDDPREANVARGVLVAFCAISLLGMPGQEVTVAVTFWTFAFWYVSVRNEMRYVGQPSARAWLPVAAVVFLFAGGTLWQARHTLRVPVRAQRVGWPYSYGVYAAEPDGHGGEQRWTSDHGVAVVEAPTPHLLLTVTPNPSASVKRVAIEVDVDRRGVIRSEVHDTRPIERYVRLPAGERRVLIETRTSRTFKPADVGLADTRDLGMLIRWRFLPAPPSAEPADVPR